MQDLALLTTFARVAETGNFSIAARDLRMTVSAVSRQIKRLEESLGVQLFARTTRSLRLTEAGEQLFAHCARGLSELTQELEIISRFGHEPQGLLRIGTTPFFGRVHLMPAILLFGAKYPLISVDLSLRHVEASFHESRVDILIRAGQVVGNGVAFQELAPMRHIICASPDYLAKQGVPKEPKELTGHNCLRATRPVPIYEWLFTCGQRKEYVLISGSFCADSVEALHAAALGGVGIARLPDYVVGPDLRSGRLVALFPRKAESPSEISYGTTVNTMKAYYLEQRFPNRKIEAFIEFLKTYFGAHYDWEQRVPDAATEH